MVRQHVNPLSRFFQLPLELPPPHQLFSDPALPLHLDIGCARGRFMLATAQQQPQRNHLGVEIRRPLVNAAEALKQTPEVMQSRLEADAKTWAEVVRLTGVKLN